MRCLASVNQWLVLLKDTALVSLISVNDLMLQTKSIATGTQEPFTWYIVAAAVPGDHPAQSVHSQTH